MMKTKNTLRNNLTKLALFSMMTLSAEDFKRSDIEALIKSEEKDTLEKSVLDTAEKTLNDAVTKFDADLKTDTTLKFPKTDIVIGGKTYSFDKKDDASKAAKELKEIIEKAVEEDKLGIGRHFTVLGYTDYVLKGGKIMKKTNYVKMAVTTGYVGILGALAFFGYKSMNPATEPTLDSNQG